MRNHAIPVTCSRLGSESITERPSTKFEVHGSLRFAMNKISSRFAGVQELSGAKSAAAAAAASRTFRRPLRLVDHAPVARACTTTITAASHRRGHHWKLLNNLSQQEVAQAAIYKDCRMQKSL